MKTDLPTPALSMRRIFRTWWPLAASWMLMGAELPVISAVMARLAQPEINLAAYGGVVFPLALIIEAPVIMLLAASTALSKDWASYKKLWRFMMIASGLMSAVHVIMAFTPFYYLVVVRILGVPAEIVEPARIGLMIMTPWTWAIGYRRFNQGVLIRFGYSRMVGVGTAIRLALDVAVLAVGYLLGNLSGIVVATSAVAVGVLSEAIYTGIRVRPVLRYELKLAKPVEPELTYRAFFDFYTPLMLTSLLILLAQPVGSAAISRMPDALSSLAVWPVVGGLVFMLRGLGFAYNEVVVALLGEPHAARKLQRFAWILAGLTSAALAIIALTPLSRLWFGRLSALAPPLVDLARASLWIALPLPALSALQSWYQGVILQSRRTQGISEAVTVFLVVNAAILWAGVVWGRMAGIYVGLIAMVLAMLAQNIWLWRRSQNVAGGLRATSQAKFDRSLP